MSPAADAVAVRSSPSLRYRGRPLITSTVASAGTLTVEAIDQAFVPVASFTVTASADGDIEAVASYEKIT